MKFQFIAATLMCARAQDGLRDYQKVICPELICESQDGDDKMDAISEDTCYLM